MSASGFDWTADLDGAILGTYGKNFEANDSALQERDGWLGYGWFGAAITTGIVESLDAGFRFSSGPVGYSQAEASLASNGQIDRYFIDEAYVQWQPSKNTPILAGGKSRVRIAQGLVMDAYQPFAALTYAVPLTATDILGTVRVIKVETDRLIGSSRSFLADAEIAWDWTDFDSVAIHGAAFSERDGIVAAMLNPYTPFVLARDTDCNADPITYAYCDEILSRYIGGGGFLTSSASRLYTFGASATGYAGDFGYRIAALGQRGTLTLHTPETVIDVEAASSNQRIGYVDAQRTARQRGWLGRAEATYIATTWELTAWALYANGETDISGGDVESFFGVLPYVPYTSIYFGGGLANSFGAGSLYSLGRLGSGLAAAGINGWFLFGDVTVLPSAAALFAATPFDGARVYGYEMGFMAEYPVGDQWRVVADAAALIAGDFPTFDPADLTFGDPSNIYQVLAGLRWTWQKF